MSEKTTPQTGSAEKEPLLNNGTADHTSAEELLDQISAKTDDFPTVESILQEFGATAAKKDEPEPVQTVAEPETQAEEPSETAEPEEAASSRPPEVQPEPEAPDSEPSAEQSKTIETPQDSVPEENTPPENAAAEAPKQETPPEEKAEPDKAEADTPAESEEASPPPGEAETQSAEQPQGDAAAEKAPPGEQPKQAAAPPDAEAPAENAPDAEEIAQDAAETPPDEEPEDDEEISGTDKAVDKLKSLWKIEKKPKAHKKFRDDPSEQDAPNGENEENPLSAAIAMLQQNETETEGMSFVERAQYRAKMRRREQTRLRRENAKHGSSGGGESTYQAVSLMDLQMTAIHLVAAAVLVIAGAVFGQSDSIAFVLYLLSFLLTAVPIAGKAVQEVSHGRFFSEHLLMLVVSLGAFLLGRRPEAAIVLILHGVGRAASDFIVAGARSEVPQQNDVVPEKAAVVNLKGEERMVSPADVRIGEFVLVRSGERVPLDGVVIRGEGTVDESIITGDSEPVVVRKDAHVLAGSLYTGSLLLMRTMVRFDDSAISRIMRVQEDGGEHKAALENSMIRMVSRFIPFMFILAVLLAIVPPLLNSTAPIQSWVYRALTLLAVSCPAALAVSVPLVFWCGSNRLSRRGVHVKGSEAIEKTAEMRMAVFNKTGTLTRGDLRIKKVYPTEGFDEQSCIALAAAAEQLSAHPVARALVDAYKGPMQKVMEFEEFPGRGVRARIHNRTILVGNHKLMISRGVKGVPEIRGTIVYVAYEGDYAGAIQMEDTVRSEAADAVRELKAQGVTRTVLLTGDSELSAQQVADAAGIDTIHFGLQPEEKAAKMDFLMRTIPTDGAEAYIGDGIHDLEELKIADVGIAMGTAGSRDTAKDANVLVMTHDLTRLGDTVRICRRTHSAAVQNMMLVVIVKILLALLALFGLVHMWHVVAVDIILSVLTVFNSARTLNLK